MSAPEVRCAGCGSLTPVNVIRCIRCRTPTRVSREQAAQEAGDLSPAERDAARRNGCLFVAPVLIALWALALWWLVA
jgi:hypothetical protein